MCRTQALLGSQMRGNGPDQKLTARSSTEAAKLLSHAFIAPTDLIDIQPFFTIILIWLRLAQRRAFDSRQLRELTLANLKGQRNEAAALKGFSEPLHVRQVQPPEKQLSISPMSVDGSRISRTARYDVQQNMRWAQ
jgi:hypothetical protein